MTEQFPTADPNWDLDSIFEGGVESAQFSEELEAVGALAEEVSGELQELRIPQGPQPEALGEWREFFDRYFEVRDRVSEAGSFGRAMSSAHADDPKALRMPARLDGIETAMRQIEVELRAAFRTIDDEAFAALVADEQFSDMELWLKELRRDAQRAMEPEMESLAVDLNRDGYHAWWRLYSEASSRLEVQIELEETTKTRSVGQAHNLLSHPERTTRRAAFEGLTEAWSSVAPMGATALNSIRGIEQTLFERRGGDHLTRPLNANRVERQTVEAMFEAAGEFRSLLQRYLNAKARVLGVDRLEWYDLQAPVGPGTSEAGYTYEEAQQFIADRVDEFSPKIADFCRRALTEQWVEAEDRGGKRPGGYCTTLPVSKQIRIFMTFGGTSSSVTTLAHELGHGYHGWVMRDLARSERRLPMGLAETASTLLEALVEQAAIRQADERETLKLLDERIGRAVTFLINIPARFQLEERMHELRAQGPLDEETLSEETAEIFGDAYGDAVASVHELYWAAKLHFFITRMPFYNFPYTFGYLFSRAVYHRAMGDNAFRERLDDLLRDTGRMRSEELAAKYLDADLGDPSFWAGAVQGLREDVDYYEDLVAQATTET